ncbi:MAG TPA: hypothetical protein VFD80_09565 [Flavobacteriaceae bacterium]|nr:hypothetical protein [Flavobacteriaceae bacterium]
MKSQKKHPFIVLIIMFLVLIQSSTTTASAQIILGDDESSVEQRNFTAPSFDDNVDDEAPINGLLGLGLLVGAYIGYRKLKKKHKPI